MENSPNSRNISRVSGADTSLLTPVKARLGRFLDVYSPEHLNRTPKPKGNIGLISFKNDKQAFITPEKYQNCNSDNKCRTVKPQQRKAPDVAADCSFEGNQSFPRVNRRLRPIRMELETPVKLKNAADVSGFRVDGPNGLRFNTSLAPEAAGSPAPSSAGWHHNLNIGKAVFTIEPNTSKILIVNGKACSLLGYSSSELCGLKFSELVKNRNSKDIKLQEHEDGDISEDGTVVLLSGKVVELVSKDGDPVQVSLWIRQLEGDGPRLVVAEPVACKNVVFTVDAETGNVLSCEGEEAAILFQAESTEKLIGVPLSTLIPYIQLPEKGTIPKNIAKQKLTGRSLDGGCFPLCLWISWLENRETRSSVKKDSVLEINVRVTYNVSGLLVLDDAGVITACNHHFAQLTFGKNHAEVIGHHIDEVIQHFCRESDLIKCERDRNMTLSPVNHRDGSASDTDEDSCGAFNGSQKSACLSHVQQSRDLADHTHTTPTQDMVSSLVPDASAMSVLSLDEEYCQSSISKSRSEHALRPDHKLNLPPNSSHYTSEDLTPTGNTPRVTLNDSSRFSFDSSKCKSSLKVNHGSNDKTSLSLDFCDSNETSADFLTPINEMPLGCEIEELPKHNGTESMDSLSNDIDLETQTESAPRKKYDEEPESACVAKRLLRSHLTTSTPQRGGPAAPARDGTYRGRVLHRDGTELNVVYTVSRAAWGGRCVWLGVHVRDAPLASAASTADNSLVLGKSCCSRPASRSQLSACGEEQAAGDYRRHYVTLKQIGKGAYGCVKMAYRRSDRLLCVAKFILKEKVGAQFWVDGPDGRRMPLELSLLLTLRHPNIVSVLDAFENDKYFQMVMERHGAGLDLFEFIERRPRLDEPLISYIFRQIGQAVEYLHSLGILHRDIKDENVIIDSRFNVKLIDFGSAAFMSRDTLFSTFYGTTEYCSPEVLAGNKYSGPELEMWSMGITLYVLTFFVNPFCDIEDTIRGPLILPQQVSEDLEQLLRWMLCKEPHQRCSVPQLLAHPWLRQPVPLAHYVFTEIVDCDRHEANPEMYYTGSQSPKSGSQLSLADPLAKERSNPSEAAEAASAAARSDGKPRSEGRRAPPPLSAADRDAHSDNYSLRSSADILDISSKPLSEAALTDISSDATGHAACDIDYDNDQLDDSWGDCDQDSFS